LVKNLEIMIEECAVSCRRNQDLLSLTSDLMQWI